MSASTMWPWLVRILAPSARADGDAKNLRLWFVVFLTWLGVLAGVGAYAIAGAEAGSAVALRIWFVTAGMFYLSLCCLFFPLPTAFVVLYLASNEVALFDSVLLRVLVVASACALATAMANLNEYHILTFFLRYQSLGRVRETRVYAVASRWFSVSPFWTITAFSFIPIPVDVVRVLAVTARYPRVPFALAYYIGRFVRYSLFAVSSAALNLSTLQIVIIQLVLAALAGLKVLHGVLVRRRKARPVDGPAAEPADPPR